MCLQCLKSNLKDGLTIDIFELFYLTVILNPMNTTHAFLKNTFDKNPSPIRFDDFIESVRNGTYSATVHKIRQFVVDMDDSQLSKSQLAKMKQQLPGIVPALCYTPGDRTGGELSGILCVDYDSLFVQTCQEFKDALAQCGSKHLLAAFTSVSGKGVAAFYRYKIACFDFVDKVDNSTLWIEDGHASHSVMFQNAPGANFDCIMAALLNAKLMLPGYDRLVKDFSRLRFVSHDSDLFYNSEAEPVGINVHLEKAVPQGKKKPIYTFSATLDSISYG